MESQNDPTASAALVPPTGKPRFATAIPPADHYPRSRRDRLGTLPFVDGFPDDATVEKVYDNLDFQRGVQAFLTAMPAASHRAQRKALRALRARQPDGAALRDADGLRARCS